ncbi:MAG TPA: hypothetical protein VNE63_22265 [Candidatus Acidoferrales bacterium]|nr:hypothetical protein [Candidatus Acidoferrales bacterium]
MKVHMKAKKVAVIATSAMLLALTACNRNSVLTHKLVATGHDHEVSLYPDEATYLKVSHRAQQGGASGMVGSAQQEFSAKKIDDQTPVNILSSDSNGSEVQIVEGPMKGTAGFVASQNVD